MTKIELYLQAYYEGGRSSRATGGAQEGEGAYVLAQLGNMTILCQRLSMLCRSAYL